MRTLLLVFLLAVVPLCFQASGVEVVVTLDDSITFQEMKGFGASMTDSSAWLIRYGLTGVERTNLINELFSPTNGIGLSYLRQPMGASDFRMQDYSYDDMPAGQTDYALANFSIAYEEAYQIPLLQQALQVNTNLRFMGSPWSAPSWMKDSGDFYYGQLKTNCYASYAAYFLKYVQAFAAHGISMDAITLQNEPLFEPYTYGGMRMVWSNQVQLAALVGQHFQTSGIATKILCYDHNWDQFQYPISVLDTPEGAQYVAGSAFHGYAGDVSVQSLAHSAHPGKDLYFTELSSGTWSGGFTNDLLDGVETLIIGAVRNWAQTVIKWNLALNQDGGPKIAGGCDTCHGVVTINSSTHAITRNADYYVLGHASKFVRPGAYRIDAQEAVGDTPSSVAFVNPDDSLVVITLNSTIYERDFTVRWNQQSFNYPLPARSVATFTWPNSAGATADVWITSANKTRLLQKQASSPVFRPNTLTWKGYTWKVSDSEGNPGNNRWSANCVQIDTNNWLRLQVRNMNGAWYCGQVESTDSPSFGTYRWKTVGRLSLLHSNVVAGLSTVYDLGHELDIEFASAYEDAPTNLSYSVQPYYQENHRRALAQSWTNVYTTHEFDWNPRRVRYRSWFGHGDAPTNPGSLATEWTYEGTDVPNDTNEHIRMNLWMYNALPPTTSQELVLADFAYTPSTGTVFRDDFEDGALSGTPCGNGSVDEQDGTLVLSPAASSDANVCSVSTNLYSWSPNGLSYLFSGHLLTVNVTSARSGGGPDIWAYSAIVSDIADPYLATNAVILRAGYHSSSNVLTLELLTKESQPGAWGTSRFVGSIDSASSFFTGDGLNLQFKLVYSNYEVSASFNSSPVIIHDVSGSVSGPHNLGTSLNVFRQVLGAQNNDDGRGSAVWAEAGITALAELESTAVSPNGSGGSGTLVQIGAGSSANSWREPVSAKYKKFRSQVLYRAPQIDAAGTITQLQIRVLSAPDPAFTNYIIRMQETSVSNLTAAFINTGWSTVYSARTDIPDGFSGWYVFSLSSNFHYNGTANLLVDFIVDSNTRDDYPRAACTFTVGVGTQGTFAGDSSGDPRTWTSTFGRDYKYIGNRFVDVRLAISNDAPPQLAYNLSFEDGPRGFLTNVPCWKVSGSEMSGLVKSSPIQHGTNVLKLWKAPGDGDQQVHQAFRASVTSEYTVTGYLLTLSSEPLTGSNAYGALTFDWYNSGGALLRTDVSAPFTATNMNNVWEFRELTAVPPPQTASGRVACALFSSDDQSGSLYFDHLTLSARPASSSYGSMPVPQGVQLQDDFSSATSGISWLQSGPWGGTEYLETNGLFGIRPGTNWVWQSSGFASTGTVAWTDSGPWLVFCGQVATISVDRTISGADIRFFMAACSQADNPWYVTNACSLFGHYDADADSVEFHFRTKADLPMDDGVDRFVCVLTNASRYLNATNRIRASFALGQSQYEVNLADINGLPLPVDIIQGATRAAHGLGTRLYTTYLMIGAQNVETNRGTVYWDSVAIYDTIPPVGQISAARQTSTDGSGRVTISNSVADANGNDCRMQLQISTNGGTAWLTPWIVAVTGSCPARLAPVQDRVQLLGIVTTNDMTGYAVTNGLAVVWDTLSEANGAGLSNACFTNLRIRLLVDDGDVSGTWVTSAVFVLDNAPPSPSFASVSIEDGAAWTWNPEPAVDWMGFTDEGGGVAGYYLAAANGGGTTAGTYTVFASSTLEELQSDAVNTAQVWACDVFGNIGLAASDTIVALSEGGDYDGDELSNAGEELAGTDPLDQDSDDDDVPDGWESTNSMNPASAADGTDDPDEDGYDNRHEYYFGTDPGNGYSRLEFEAVPAADDSVIIRWNSAHGRLYTLYTATNAASEWQVAPGCSNVAGNGETMTFTGSVSGAFSGLHRLRARVSP